jgi:hypothetical protein
MVDTVSIASLVVDRYWNKALAPNIGFMIIYFIYDDVDVDWMCEELIQTIHFIDQSC